MSDDTARATTRRRRLPGWLLWGGGGLAGLSLVVLPVALVVAGLDIVRREGVFVEQAVVLGALILGAVVLVVAIERGLTYAVGEHDWSLWSAAGVIVGLGALVLLGVLLPGLGLVLVALGVVAVALLLPALLAFVGWLRWRTGPRPAPRVRPSTAEVRARAEERRVAVRARNDTTRRAVAAGLIGPGFTRGDR